MVIIMMFGKCLTKSYTSLNVLKKINELDRISSTCSRNKSKLYLTRKHSVFHNDKFLLKCAVESRQLHTGVKLRALEISHAYSILQNSEAYTNNIASSLTAKEDVENTQVEQLIKRKWDNMNNQQLLQNFEMLSYYANKNNECISDSKYFKILEVMASSCKSFNKKELLQLLRCLELWPVEGNRLSFEMTIIAKAIDKEYVKILHKLNTDMIFLINDYFFKIKFLWMSQFTNKSLKSLDLQKLTSANLVHLMFFMIVKKKLDISLSDLEYHLWKFYDKFTLQELGIIGITFFKRKTKIENKQFLLEIMKKLQNNIDSVDDVTLTLLLKIIRYSVRLDLLAPFINFLRSLTEKIQFLSLQTITQIVHLMANSLIHDKEVMLHILNRYEKEIGEARLKDIERISFALYLFDYNPKSTPFYSAAAKEILNPKRTKEIEFFPLSLAYTVMYMLQMNFYSEELLNYVMDPNFINKVSNGVSTNLQREYLIIDYCIELDHPEYQGPRLNTNLLDYLKKYGVFYKDPPNRKVDQFKKLVIDICHTYTGILQTESAVYTDFLLPHITSNQIVLCYDPLTNKYISPSRKLSHMPLGSIKYAPDDGKKWYAIVVASQTKLTRDIDNPTGLITMQMRHLERIGYTPILIKYNNWLNIKKESDKKKFLSSLVPK